MRDQDRQEFQRLLGDVMGYYGRNTSPFLIGVFWEGLARFDLPVVKRAFSLHAQDPDRGQFPPKVADIVRVIEGTTGDRAVRAWTQVRHAVQSIGPYQSLVFDDPLIHVVLADMGGFQALCDMKTDDVPFRARDFSDRYRAYAARREIPAYDPKLIGIVEADCLARGFHEHIPPPVLVGDPQRCAKVLANGTGRKAVASVPRPKALVRKAAEVA